MPEFKVVRTAEAKTELQNAAELKKNTEPNRGNGERGQES